MMNMIRKLKNIHHENMLMFLTRSCVSDLEKDIIQPTFNTLKRSPSEAFMQKDNESFEKSECI